MHSKMDAERAHGRLANRAPTVASATARRRDCSSCCVASLALVDWQAEKRAVTAVCQHPAAILGT